MAFLQFRRLSNIFNFFCLLYFGSIGRFAIAQPIQIGSPPSTVVILDKDDGGRVDGSSWSSSELTGKISLLFYVDPDEKKSNEALEKALKKEEFPFDTFHSTAIINMGATWLPNIAIAASLASKQREFPKTLYVKDLKKKIVKAWDLEDDAYNVLLFNRKGELLFKKSGTLSAEEISGLIAIIQSNL